MLADNRFHSIHVNTIENSGDVVVKSQGEEMLQHIQNAPLNYSNEIRRQNSINIDDISPQKTTYETG